MQPRQLRIYIGLPTYAGNGGCASMSPQVAKWLARTVPEMKADERCQEVIVEDICDTPITMVRNRFVERATQEGADVLLMVDSDQDPLLYEREPEVRPFWKDSFDFLCQRYERGPVCVFAPYGGPPPHENVYVFRFGNKIYLGPEESPITLDQYTREEASQMAGIQEAAAGPTGMFLADMRCFDLLAPGRLPKGEVLDKLLAGEISKQEAEHLLHEGWFYYEWKTSLGAEKASTEDVTFTRDLALVGSLKLGYNPLFCNWDAWVGHCKPWTVGKPRRTTVQEVGARFQSAVLSGRDARRKQFYFSNDALLERLERQQAQLPPAPNGKPRDIEKDCPPPDRLIPYWNPDPKVTRLIESYIRPRDFVVDVGPGSRPFERAQDLVGRPHDAIPAGKVLYELDLNSDRLPHSDREVDFLYCRHTLEDLDNPAHLLREINRVAQRGYLETPSPIAECCRGVDSPTSNVPGRGYAHHRSLVWVENGVLMVLPKLPALESLPLDEEPLRERLREGFKYWNTYFCWEGELRFRILRHEIDFKIGCDNGYLEWVEQAIYWSVKNADAFYRELEANLDAPRAC